VAVWLLCFLRLHEPILAALMYFGWSLLFMAASFFGQQWRYG